MTWTGASVSDEDFQALRATARSYSVVLLRPGPNRHMDGADAIIYSHGMRNASLHLDGRLPIVCPSIDASDFRGLGVFACSLEETSQLMDADPAVMAGVLGYEVHPVRSFPGSTLPG